LNLCEYNGVSSASKTSMLSKLACPTPTITIERGRSEPLTIWSMVAYRSLITPSVMIIKIWYCWLYADDSQHSALSLIELIISAKFVGPYRLTLLMAFL
jgi:hypothetical protein